LGGPHADRAILTQRSSCKTLLSRQRRFRSEGMWRNFAGMRVQQTGG
jgi:hypothetical protein